jgi:hypothetical protein
MLATKAALASGGIPHCCLQWAKLLAARQGDADDLLVIEIKAEADCQVHPV